MKFTLTTEQRDVAATLHDLLSTADTPAVARAWAAGDHEPGRTLWRKLGALGVWGLLVPECEGGLGAAPADAVVAWEACGYHAVPGPVVETVGVAARLLASEPDALRRIAAGETIATAALPPDVPLAIDADVADVVVRSDGEVTRVGCRVGAASHRAGSIDRVRRLFPLDGGDVVAAPGVGAYELGVLGVSAQLVGAAGRMLDMAAAYAVQRSQYGRTIGSYQAVKHLLADVAVRVEMAWPAVYGAAVAAANPERADLAGATSAAKVAATRAALLAARTALQVHGAVGYTAEHDLGLWLTKVRALAGAWGSTDRHRRRVLEALGNPALGNPALGNPACGRSGGTRGGRADAG